jgi:hypothetical protein
MYTHVCTLANPPAAHKMEKQWQSNISKIELQILLKAICNNPECFEKEIEKRRLSFNQIPNHTPMSPTECTNTPIHQYATADPACELVGRLG